MIEIDYFDFLRKYPELVIMDEYLIDVDTIDYINYVESLNKNIVPPIDREKFSKLIYEGKTNGDKSNIFKNEITFFIDNLPHEVLVHEVSRIKFLEEDNKFYQFFNKYEHEGKFSIITLSSIHFYKLNKEELKNIKRYLTIEKCLR